MLAITVASAAWLVVLLPLAALAVGVVIAVAFVLYILSKYPGQ